MASTKVILIFNKIKKNDEVPLYLRIIKDRKPKYVSLGIAVEAKFWDDAKQCVIKKHPNAERMNNYIQHKKTEAMDVVLDLVTDSKYVEVKTLKNAIHGLSPIDFFPFGFKYIKIYESKGQIGTYNKFHAVLTKMQKYVDGSNFTLTDLTLNFLKQYETYCRKEYKNSTNTITSNFKCIRRILNEAILQDKLPYEKNPFLKYKMTSEKTEIVFLTEEELTILENYSLKPGTMKDHHRNLYLFACNAGGIRISDLLQLKWENYDGQHILLNTQKTGSVVSILLPSKAKAMLEKYKKPDSKNDDFIFPFLYKSDNFKDPRILHKRISSCTAYMNTNLDEIAKAAEIKKHIHFHTSRHTWATRALRKGMRIEYVSKLMGHSSIRTTQVYAKIVNADLDKAMEVFEEIPEPPAKFTKKKKASS
jgi:integrase